MKGAESLLKGSRKQEVFTSAQLQEHFRKKALKSKYGARSKEYCGVTYQSTKEANHAAYLDFGIRAGLVEKWERQVNYKLIVNGILITTYRLDFKVYFTDGSIQYQDVKGAKKGVPYDLFTAKKRLMLACNSIEVIEI